MIKLIKKIRMIFIRIKYRKMLVCGKNFTCGRGTTFFARNKIIIGEDVYIGKYCSIETDMKIGNGVRIANLVGIVGKYDHNFAQVGKSIYHTDWIGDKNYNWKGKNQLTIIGDDVWIGFNSIILSGVKIGRGSIISAGSVIVEDVEPYSIMGGVPAKVLKKRFKETEIKQHEKVLYKSVDDI